MLCLKTGKVKINTPYMVALLTVQLPNLDYKLIDETMHLLKNSSSCIYIKVKYSSQISHSPIPPFKRSLPNFLQEQLNFFIN